MELKCKINGITYENVVQGEAFDEEYNETLDSGSLVISHQTMIRDLKPYDDVYVWDSNYEFLGFDKDKLFMKKNDIEYTYIFDWDNREFILENDDFQKVFFKHLLVSNFSEKMINLKDFTQQGVGVGEYTPIYEYTIQLMSETKGLETVKLPNLSITEPLNQMYKVSVFEYMKRYISLYSPVYKKVKDEKEKTWEFEKKYSLSPSLEIIFGNIYSPDFSSSGRNLKEYFNKLMSTKDMIVYVMNNVIYAMYITKRRGEFVIDEHINYISGSMSSNDYCDNLRRNYSNAISKNNSARLIEYLGFRNNDNALMTLGNMRLETRFPIYKINKIYMCYYKKVKIPALTGNGSEDRIFLCKQDITPLVKLGTERNVLSQDWEKLNRENPYTVEEMSKFKMCTVEYNIGSKHITGWGDSYTYPKKGTFWDITKNFIQNIFEKLDTANPYGVYGVSYVKNMIGYLGNYKFDTMNPLDNIVTGLGVTSNSEIPNALKLKTFTFEVDYQAFYNGTVIHSKDFARDNITINDNPEEALSLLESDGIAAKEKINRYGNKAITINARYDDISQIQPLGSVFHDFETGDDDIIIYHREYSIYSHYVKCIYYGMHDYVLKNFYTSVYAKHRTWNLMPYGEATTRSENRKNLLLLSKKSLYWENINDEDIFNHKFLMTNFSENNDFIKLILSAFAKNKNPVNGAKIENDDKLNFAFINYYHYDINDTAYPKQNKTYLSDLNSFVSGNSMCFNVVMPDNISGGNYISKFRPNFNNYNNKENPSIETSLLNYVLAKNVENDYTGSIQEWKKSANDYGFAKKMGFYLGHYESNMDKEIFSSSSSVENLYTNYLFKLPYIKDIEEKNITNKIGNDFEIYKDNKEVIDMTYQIEPITDDKDIYFSPWLMQLSNLITNSEKFEADLPVVSDMKLEGNFQIFCGTHYIANGNRFEKSAKRSPYFVIKMPKNLFHTMKIVGNKNANIHVTDAVMLYRIDEDLNAADYPKCITVYENQINSIQCFENNEQMMIKLSIKEYFSISPAINRSWTQYRDITLQNIEKLPFDTSLTNKEFEDDGYYYFAFYEYPLTFVPEYTSADNSEYISFVGQIDWKSDGKTIDAYEINSNITGDRPIDILNGDKCYKINASFISDKYDDNYVKYLKSMYVGISKNKDKKLNKEIIYEKFGFAETYDSENKVYKKDDVVLYDNKVYMYINERPMKHPSEFTIDGGYEFGEDEDGMDTIEKITNWKQIENAVIKGNLYKVTHDVDYWNGIDFELTDNLVTETFSVMIDEENGGHYINVNLNGFEEKPETIQYWFMENGTLNFVFGVNVSDDDWNKKTIKIYVSSLTTRDMRVYDDKYNLIGSSLNILENSLPPYASIEQYYDVPSVPKYILNYNDQPEVNFMIERKLSPYGNGELGPLNSGDIIYYGDVIYTFAEIIGEASSIEVYVNGKDETKQITYLGKDITVKSDLNININVKEFEYIELPLDQSRMPISFETVVQTEFEKSQYVSLVVPRTTDLINKVRISGTFNYVENGETNNYNFENLETSLGNDFFTFGNNCTLRVTYSQNLWEYQIHCYGTPDSYGVNINITKFEEYR